MEIRQECMWLEDPGSCSDMSEVQTKSDLLTLYETREEEDITGASLDVGQVMLKQGPGKLEHGDIHSETCTTSELKIEDHRDEIEIEEEFPDLLINLVVKREIEEENIEPTFHDRFRDAQKQERGWKKKYERIVYPCTLCSQSYLTKRSLMLHMKVHKAVASEIQEDPMWLEDLGSCSELNEVQTESDLFILSETEEKKDETVGFLDVEEVTLEQDCGKWEHDDAHLETCATSELKFEYHSSKVEIIEELPGVVNNLAETLTRKIPNPLSMTGTGFPCKDCNLTFSSPIYLRINHKCSRSGNHLPNMVPQKECVSNSVVGGQSGSALEDLQNHVYEIQEQLPQETYYDLNGTENASCFTKVLLQPHTAERPFICTECGKTFLSSFDLDRHTRIHTGEKGYSCHECGKTFTQSYSLSRHLKIHTGERPFICTECGKKFIESSALRDHLQMHTGEKPYSCNECDKNFRRSRCLRRHILIHTGEKPFSCHECSKKFTESTYLRRHLQTHVS